MNVSVVVPVLPHIHSSIALAFPIFSTSASFTSSMAYWSPTFSRKASKQTFFRTAITGCCRQQLVLLETAIVHCCYRFEEAGLVVAETVVAAETGFFSSIYNLED